MGLFICDKCGYQGDPSEMFTHECPAGILLERAIADIDRLLVSPGLKVTLSGGGVPVAQTLENEYVVLVERHTLRVLLAALRPDDATAPVNVTEDSPP